MLLGWVFALAQSAKLCPATNTASLPMAGMASVCPWSTAPWPGYCLAVFMGCCVFIWALQPGRREVVVGRYGLPYSTPFC